VRMFPQYTWRPFLFNNVAPNLLRSYSFCSRKSGTRRGSCSSCTYKCSICIYLYKRAPNSILADIRSSLNILTPDVDTVGGDIRICVRFGLRIRI
jgi:hypothetical protein